MPAGPAPTTAISAACRSAMRLDAHSGRAGLHAGAAMRYSVDRDAALEADSHRAEKAAPFAHDRGAKVGEPGVPHGGRDGRSLVGVDRAAIDKYREALQCAPPGMARLGSNGPGSIAGISPVISAARISPVPVAVVIPRPSWPAAIQGPGRCVSEEVHWPISGSLSGVAGRNPVQTRIAERPASAGMNSTPRRIIFSRMSGFGAGFQPTNSREEPMRNWPVARG